MAWCRPVTVPCIHPPHHGHPKVTDMLMIDSHPSRPMSIGPPISEVMLFQNLFENSRPRSWVWQKGNDTWLLSIQLSCFLSISHQSDQQLIQLFRAVTLKKSQIDVMCEVKAIHIIDPVSNRCPSFPVLVNRSNYSWGMANSIWPWKTHLQFWRKFAKKIRHSSKT